MGGMRDLEGRLVTLIGGSGFFGSRLTQELLGRGARVRIGCRHVERASGLKPLASLGQMQVVRLDMRAGQEVAAAVAGADAVVNLVGAFTGDLDAVQGSGAGRVAALAREAGARAFVQISAIGADAGSPVAYARTKAAGEGAVAAAFPGAVVVRPSVLFGPDDAFLGLFAKVIAQFPLVPVFAPHARLQPLFVDDAARAVAEIVAGWPAHAGRTFELAGPEVVTMLDLNARIAAAQERRRRFLAVPEGLADLFARLPGTPLSMDQLTLLRAGNVASGVYPGLDDLEVPARPLGLFLKAWMARFSR